MKITLIKNIFLGITVLSINCMWACEETQSVAIDPRTEEILTYLPKDIADLCRQSLNKKSGSKFLDRKNDCPNCPDLLRAFYCANKLLEGCESRDVNCQTYSNDSSPDSAHWETKIKHSIGLVADTATKDPFLAEDYVRDTLSGFRAYRAHTQQESSNNKAQEAARSEPIEENFKEMNDRLD